MPSNLLGTTLLDMAAIEQQPLKKAIMFSMFSGQLPSPMEKLPVETTQALTQRNVRLTDAGSPSTRNVGQSVATYAAKFSTGQETLKIIENKITIDAVLLDQKDYIQDPITLQFKAYMMVVKNTVNDLFINGDPGSDVTQPAGIDYRLRNDATFLGQAVDGNNLDVDASDANRHTWLDHITTAITLVRGVADFIITNRQTWIKLTSAARNLKLYDTTRDQFDRKIHMFDGVPFYDAGQKPAGVLTAAAAQQVIGDDGATSIFGTASTTPMYFVNVAKEDGVKLLQLHPLKIKDLGQDPGDPGVFVHDVRWPIGFLIAQKFAIASIEGLNIT